MTEKYNRLVQAVELNEIALTDLRHRRKLLLRRPLAVEYALKIRLVSSSDQEIVARADLLVSAFPTQNEEQENNEEKTVPDVSIKLTYHVRYTLHQSEFRPSRELARQFVERNVPINVWPFMRETVAALTAKMGLEPLLLPTLKIMR